MKKIFISVLFMFLILPAYSQTIEGGITFDWISKTQLQRDENIKQVQNILFTDNTVYKYPKKEFKAEYAAVWKDKAHLKNYEEVLRGKKEDAENYYCGFHLKNGVLFAYGVQPKKNMKHIYYYDAMGRLIFVDNFSTTYPNFPYESSQYYKSGELVAKYYYVSGQDQYAFDAKKKFKGRWYKEKMYNRNAKIIMTRSHY